jgi:hypothetical protein
MVIVYQVVRIQGIRQSGRRGIVLLDCNGDDRVDAARVFGRMSADEQMVDRVRELRTRFDHWIDNVQTNDRWFHGFRSYPEYRECFVFKCKSENVGQRLYGFLCHPQRQTNARFELCVLTNHAEKPHAQWETDVSELTLANALRVNPAVLAAIAMEFPERGAHTWKN